MAVLFSGVMSNGHRARASICVVAVVVAVRVTQSQGMEPGTRAVAREVRVLSAVGMRQVILALAPRFERETGHTLAITFDSGAVIAQRVQRGETPDIVVIPRAAIDDLVRAGAMSATSKASFSSPPASTPEVSTRRSADDCLICSRSRRPVN
jgi:ABC-type molybdate transport system substrate-binding protein